MLCHFDENRNLKTLIHSVQFRLIKYVTENTTKSLHCAWGYTNDEYRDQVHDTEGRATKICVGFTLQCRTGLVPLLVWEWRTHSFLNKLNNQWRFFCDWWCLLSCMYSTILTQKVWSMLREHVDRWSCDSASCCSGGVWGGGGYPVTH